MANKFISFNEKRKGEKMKKTRKILIFCVACVFALLAAFSLYKGEVKLVADQGEVSTNVQKSNLSAYEQYIAEKTEYHKAKYGNDSVTTPKLSTPIVIYGQDYNVDKSTIGIADNGYNAIDTLNIAKHPEYKNSESANNGKDSIIVHYSGDLTFDVEVEKAGFYTLYLNYYTFKGFSSNIERILLIDGRTPFEGCNAFTFTRVWQDAAVTKTKDDVCRLHPHR